MYNRKQKVAEEKWKVVAEYLKASKPTTNYSQNACRNRFEALENDTATIPPELADFPEKCRVQRATAEETYASGSGGARRQRNIPTFEGNVDSGDDYHGTDLPKRGIGNSKTAANGHGKARTARLFPITSLRDANIHSMHEDMVSSDNDSGDDEGKSDVSVKLSPDVESPRNKDGRKSRLAKAAVSTIPTPVVSTHGRIRGEMGASATSQHNMNITSDVGAAKAHPKGVTLFPHAARGKFNSSP